MRVLLTLVWENTIITVLTIGFGSVLTLGIQLLVNKVKDSREDRVKLRQLKAKAQSKTFLIGKILEDLAMYKVHKQYYRRAAALNETDKEMAQDSFKKHYEKGQESRDTQKKLNVALAELIEILSEYIFISKSELNMEEHFKKIRNYIPMRSKDFKDVASVKELVAGLQPEEKRLRLEYAKFVDYLDDVLKKL